MPQNIVDEHKDKRDLKYVLYHFVTPLFVCTSGKYLHSFYNICLLKTTKVRIELLERELFQFLFTISDSDFKTRLFNLQVFSLCGSTFLTSIKTRIQFTKLYTLTNAPYFLMVRVIIFLCRVVDP